ncbi:hypothetical protein ACE6H2_007196 [Prunus campanulata]
MAITYKLKSLPATSLLLTYSLFVVNFEIIRLISLEFYRCEIDCLELAGPGG